MKNSVRSFVASLAAFVGSCLYAEDEDIHLVKCYLEYLEVDEEVNFGNFGNFVFISFVVENEVDDEQDFRASRLILFLVSVCGVSIKQSESRTLFKSSS